MDFLEVARRVFAMYGDRRYEEALQLIEAARDQHPDQDTQITFWKACFESISGKPERALESLESGMARGLWWSPDTLLDADLDSARELPQWASLVEQCADLTAEFTAANPPRPRFKPGNPGAVGTIIALHGAGADPDHFANTWRRAVSEDWDLVCPEGTVPFTASERSWSNDHPGSASPAQLDQADLRRPFVLAGYSQGSGVAAWWAWTGAVEAVGLILLSPGSAMREWNPSLHVSLPTYIFVGESDWLVEESRVHSERLRKRHVPVHLEIRADFGHHVPEDLDLVLGGAIAWVTRP